MKTKDIKAGDKIRISMNDEIGTFIEWDRDEYGDVVAIVETNVFGRKIQSVFSPNEIEKA